MPTANYLFVQRVLQQPGVRRKLLEIAQRKAAQARLIAASEDPTAHVPVEVSSGTRPKGRPYARISVPAANEYGDYKTKRLRLLARVVNL
jgi:hypothetical protein